MQRKEQKSWVKRALRKETIRFKRYIVRAKWSEAFKSFRRSGVIGKQLSFIITIELTFLSSEHAFSSFEKTLSNLVNEFLKRKWNLFDLLPKIHSSDFDNFHCSSSLTFFSIFTKGPETTWSLANPPHTGKKLFLKPEPHATHRRSFFSVFKSNKCKRNRYRKGREFFSARSFSPLVCSPKC